MAQVYTAEAILALVAIMRGKGQGRERIHAQARAYAASALLDRGHGKPAQGHTGESGAGPVTINLIEELHPVAQLDVHRDSLTAASLPAPKWLEPTAVRSLQHEITVTD
jgi:hypothetical protein